MHTARSYGGGGGWVKKRDSHKAVNIVYLGYLTVFNELTCI